MGEYRQKDTDTFKKISRLTASQIEAFDEIMRDKNATARTMEVAINFTMNRLSEIEQEESKIWEEILTANGIERTYSSPVYTYRKIDGIVYLVEVVPKEN